MIGLQEYLMNNKISIRQFAKDIDVSATAISKWFSNKKVPLKYYNRIMNAINIEKNYIDKIVNNIEHFDIRCKEFNEYEIRGDVTAIFLENKKGLKLETIIDTKNLERIKAMGLHWHLRFDPKTRQYYARATGRKSERQKANYYLHMVIMNFDFDPKNWKVVDHENQNKLDNRESNLRFTDQSCNSTHKKSKNKNNRSGYRNVFWNKWLEKWTVSLTKNYKIIVRKDFDDLEEAAKFAEESRQKYFGKFAGQS